MLTICTPEAMDDVDLVRPCLNTMGDSILEECQQPCGNWTKVDQEVLRISKTYEFNALNGMANSDEFMIYANDACGILKCSNRCVVRNLNERCPVMLDGRKVGEIVQGLIEYKLNAQLKDINSLRMTKQLQQTMPMQCNYMFMPDVMFNVTNDDAALEMLSKDLQKKLEQNGLKKLGDYYFKKF